MTSRTLLRSILSISFFTLFAGVHPATANSSHVRIIRLSLVQGDVRFTREAHGDPLADEKAVWETAELNLPIRQGYFLATDNGRAQVEFENGAMVFLNENTVLEFFDLSLQDGARTTRLVLRQGTASVYVNPARGDYFSVTGGDFTVETDGRATFRIDNFDDGSNVDVLAGRVSVIHKNDTKALAKGQSLSVKAGEDSTTIGRLPTGDDFDRWVSGRIDSVVTATNAALQYTNSPYYSSGFGDLYTYGSWFPMSGYGYGWRPYGVGLGWSPFDNGSWFFDPFFGWTFCGFQPWGWAPFHFGSWLFQPGFGWVWLPGGFGNGGFHNWRPSTGVFVRGRGGSMGVVPVHPLDVHGRTPINLAQGVFPVRGGTLAGRVPLTQGENWKIVKSPPRETLNGGFARATPPLRVSRTVLDGNSGGRAVSVGQGQGGQSSAIIYDPRERRFVNTNSGAPSTPSNVGAQTERGIPDTLRHNHIIERSVGVTPPNGAARSTGPPTSARPMTPSPSARAPVPPPAPRASASGSERVSGGGAQGGGGSSRGSSGGSSSGSSSSGGGSSRGGESGRSAPAPSSSSHPSPAPSSRPH